MNLEGFVLCRYMAKEYSEKMVNDGEIRISRSSKYKDGAGMTDGQRDDEHRKSVVIHASEVWEREHDRLDPRVNSEIVKLNTNDDQYKIDTTLNEPYWVLCLSVDLRLDLFDEFNSDAAVVIHQPAKLIERMRESSKILVPSSESRIELIYQPVQYLDGLVAYGRTGLVISPCFTKPEKYIHQKEYRIVWYPCYSNGFHEHLQLGSLRDISEVVLKDELKNGIVRERIFDERSFHKAAEEAVRNNL